jgi:flagellar transcriptional activator FlhC
MLKTFNQHSLALELLKRDARISIIHKETSVPKQLLRKTYRDLHGCSASPGASKYSTQGLTPNLKNYKEVTLFAVCFQKVESKSQESNIRKVIIAFDIYKKAYPSSQLDFSAAWVDRKGPATGHYQDYQSHHCGAAILLNAREDASDRCGVCKTSMRN